MSEQITGKLEKAIDEVVIAYATGDIEIVRAKTEALIKEGRSVIAALRKPEYLDMKCQVCNKNFSSKINGIYCPTCQPKAEKEEKNE